MDTLRYAEGGQRTCALHPEQHKMAGSCTESTSTCDRRLGKRDHGDILGEGGSNLLSAPDRAPRRSSYVFAGPAKGDRKRGNARRRGYSIPTWSRGPRT